jgi:hypothetical protein
MKLYSLNSKLDFGDHKGKTLREVFLKDPEYIQECVLEHPTFCFNPSNVDALEDLHTDFSFSDASMEKLDEKYEIYEEEENEFEDEKFSDDDLKNLGIMDDFDDEYDDIGEGGGFYDDNY